MLSYHLDSYMWIESESSFCFLESLLCLRGFVGWEKWEESGGFVELIGSCAMWAEVQECDMS